MQLAPGERAILAYFPSSDKAETAAEELKNAGYDTVQVDRISRYGIHHDPEINYPVAGRAVSGTGLVVHGEGTDDLTQGDMRVLIAADPSVSGMAAMGYGTAGGRAFLVTVVTHEEKVQQAVEILRKHGGEV